MADPRIDREAWARLVAELIQQESGGNQTHFSIAVGVDRKTVSRWLKAEVDVSEDKVRAVARALGVPVAELLVKVGYYQAVEMPDEPARPAPEEDPAVQVILASDAPPSLKRELVAYLREQRAEQERQRIEEARRLLSVAQRARRRRAG